MSREVQKEMVQKGCGQKMTSADFFSNPMHSLFNNSNGSHRTMKDMDITDELSRVC